MAEAYGPLKETKFDREFKVMFMKLYEVEREQIFKKNESNLSYVTRVPNFINPFKTEFSEKGNRLFCKFPKTVDGWLMGNTQGHSKHKKKTVDVFDRGLCI